MIEIRNIDVYGWESAIRGMRNPMNSWEKSDSFKDIVVDEVEVASGEWQEIHENSGIGDNDLALMKKLIAAGTDHSKFMRMINVTMDIIAPLYWWAEYDTYKVGTVANSCSKMHKLLSKPFEINDFSFDKLIGYKKEIKHFRPEIDEEKEIWKEDNSEYKISNQGRIKNGNRIISGSIHKDNYIYVTIRGTQIPIHRLVASAFISNPDGLPEVNHKDGNKQNNCVDNLEWCTRSENMKHAYENYLEAKPVNTYNGKFSAEQREEIKKLWDSGKISKREVARRYNVSHTCINDIINDKYKYTERVDIFKEVAKPLIDTLNEMRDSYLCCNNETDKKRIWYSILQLLPESYNQLRTVQLNYAVLRNMYHARKEHKLDEWRDFCKRIETLEYSELITT